MKKSKFLAFLMAFCLILPTIVIAVAASDTAALPKSIILGDANADGEVNTRDVIAMRRYLADLDYATGESSLEIDMSADMDRDGEVRLYDLYLLRYFIENGSFANEYSRGLEYVSNGNGTCRVSGIGSCTDLNIIIPARSPDGDNVTEIGNKAFFGCASLTSITVSAGVTSIGAEAFEGCTSLTSIKVDKNNVNYCSIDGDLYNKSATALIRYAVGKTDASFAIPDSVTSIGEYAFSGCASLASIVIPERITSVGARAFSHCSKLTVYCEAASRPNGWSADWNYTNCSVVWGYGSVADTLKIVSQSVQGKVGDEVQVSLIVESNPGFAAMRLYIPLAPGVEFVSAQRGVIVDGFTAGSNGTRFLWDASSNSTKTGVLATFTYRITTSAQIGDIALNVKVIECWNEQYDEVAVEAQPIVIKVVQ